MRREGVSTIDVQQLIDRLESLVTNGMRLPLSSKALIDEQEFLDIIDQLRVSIPEEVKQARRVSQEKDRVILHAETEAGKIINSARDQANLMLQESDLVRQAEEQAQQIVNAADGRAVEICQGADQYASDVLAGLETELSKVLGIVRKGRATLERSTREKSPYELSPDGLNSDSH